MAHLSPEVVKELLIAISQRPETEPNFIKFERRGILVDKPVESEDPSREDPVKDSADVSQLYSCSVCKKKLVSAHLLDLHFTENHDSYFDLQKLRKPMVSWSSWRLLKMRTRDLNN